MGEELCYDSLKHLPVDLSLTREVWVFQVLPLHRFVMEEVPEDSGGHFSEMLELKEEHFSIEMAAAVAPKNLGFLKTDHSA